MITRVGNWLSTLRRWFSRNEWLVWWFGLPREIPSDQAGLILIQIDGLSRVDFERAIRDREVPFLESQLRREHYRLHSMYSGLPSTTPAVQAELFYGKRCAVPAFGFKDRGANEFVRMFSPTAAFRVQEKLSENADGLLLGGSAYCNIYDGGAEESHFCAASFGWDRVIADLNPIRVALGLAFYGFSLLRAAGLTAIEVVFALASFARRSITGREFWQELLLVPSRVMIAVLMRELCVIGASMDVARGLPIIHVNFLGYDEHAHRRGPSSKFAHWTLRGIDQAIRRIASAANRSTRRHYDIWFYSDHGQENTIPYMYIAGKSVEQACRESLQTALDNDSDRDASADDQSLDSKSSTMGRASWFSASAWVTKLFGDSGILPNPDSAVAVTAIGPVGHVYLSSRLWSQSLNGAPMGDNSAANTRETILNRFASDLVIANEIPMAAFTDKDGRVRVLTAKGEALIPSESKKIFGKDHPFLEVIGEDFYQLCKHPNAGEVVIGGWTSGSRPVSFPLQNGAHGGIGSQETHAFALLPVNAPLDRNFRTLRPEQLRIAAMRLLGRCADGPQNPPAIESNNRHQVRVMTYNVHSCVGMDGKLSPARIAKLISRLDVDVVAIQEVDVGRKRSKQVDQAQLIASHLTMNHHFHATWQIEEESYGIAVLSRLPMHLVKSGLLPSSKDHRERRCVIWVEVELGNGKKCQILNTHLSLYPRERLRQAQALTSEEWIGTAVQRGATIVCGDFNAAPGSRGYGQITKVLEDAHQIAIGDTKRTFMSLRPVARIDHIFCSSDVTPVTATVVNSKLAQIASDHLPLVANMRLSP